MNVSTILSIKPTSDVISYCNVIGEVTVQAFTIPVVCLVFKNFQFIYQKKMLDTTSAQTSMLDISILELAKVQ